MIGFRPLRWFGVVLLCAIMNCGGGGSAPPTAVPPVIQSQPTNQSVIVGGITAFQVQASSSGTLSYQWQKNGVDIAHDASASRLVLADIPLIDHGAIYRVVVRDSLGGSVVSSGATLTVTPSPFVATGSLITARSGHTATLLDDGRVLVVGGDNAGAIAQAEVYDPSTGKFSATGSLLTARSGGHSATKLLDGRVAIIGGWGPDYKDVATVEIYRPDAGTFAVACTLGTARSEHTATLLQDGTVLVAGGSAQFQAIPSSEIFDPVAGTVVSSGSLGTKRYSHGAVLLAGGKVLMVGGEDNCNCTYGNSELYDPATGTFSPDGAIIEPRSMTRLNLLGNGQILMSGGYSLYRKAAAGIELINPPLGTSSAVGSLGRYAHTGTLLDSDLVLLAGGANDTSYALQGCWVFSAANNALTWAGPLFEARCNHTATRLLNGKVLIAGGEAFTYLSSAEIYTKP